MITHNFSSLAFEQIILSCFASVITVDN